MVEKIDFSPLNKVCQERFYDENMGIYMCKKFNSSCPYGSKLMGSRVAKEVKVNNYASCEGFKPFSKSLVDELLNKRMELLNKIY